MCESKNALCQMLLSILPSGLQVPKGRSAYGWQLCTVWSRSTHLIMTWIFPHYPPRMISQNDGLHFGISLWFLGSYISQGQWEISHMATWLYSQYSYQPLLFLLCYFLFFLFFKTIFQQNHKDNKCSRRMSSNQGVWQRIYKKGATKALCATNKQNHEQ